MRTSKTLLVVAVVAISCNARTSKNVNEQVIKATIEDIEASIPKTGDFENVAGAHAHSLLMDPEIITVDIRTPDEVSQGYITGADIFIDFYDDFDTKVEKLDRNKGVLLYCQSGGRSTEAAQRLIDMGFPRVYNLEGGFQSWTGDVSK